MSINHNYLSEAWVKASREKYGVFGGKLKEELRKPSKTLDISEWLSIHNLEVFLYGSALRFSQGGTAGTSNLVLIGSGGCFIDFLQSEIFIRDKKGKPLEVNLNQIEQGFEKLCEVLNSDTAEAIASFLYLGEVTPFWGKSSLPYLPIRSTKWPNTERWTTQIVFDEVKSKGLIQACIKELVKKRVTLDVDGMSKYINQDDLVSNAPEPTATTQFIGLSKEYGIKAVSTEAEIETELELG